MCVAGPKDFRDDLSRSLRVATKFVSIAKAYYAAQGRDIDIIKLNGSIELAPLLGLSDVIVDIVETGTTLKENDLKVLTEFMGWNSLQILRDDPLFRYFRNGEYVYYVHSFYARNCAASTLGTSQYGSVSVTGAVRRGNVWGTQFHPEKSGDAGLRLLKAFSEL